MVSLSAEAMKPSADSAASARHESAQSKSNIVNKYKTIADCLGDSLVARLPMPAPAKRELPAQEDTVFLGDADSHRTGEEMLQVHVN